MRVVAAVLSDGNGKVCVTCRPFEKPFGGYWEFPGGKVEDIDDFREDRALARELLEELGIELQPPLEKVCSVSFQTKMMAIDVAVYYVTKWKGTPDCLELQQCLEWVSLDTLSTRPMTPGTRAALEVLRRSRHAHDRSNPIANQEVNTALQSSRQAVGDDSQCNTMPLLPSPLNVHICSFPRQSAHRWG